MAMKDWKKIRESLYVSKKSYLQIWGKYYVGVSDNNMNQRARLMEKFKTKKEQMNFAKQYMRTH